EWWVVADIEVPEWAEGVLGALGGQPWPQLSESFLVRESEQYAAAAVFLVRFEKVFEADALGAARAMKGEGARAMEASVSKLLYEVPAGQKLPAFKSLIKSYQDTADNLRKIAIAVETAKVTILGMVAFLLAQLADSAAALV
ncbi:hypothetical protein, partial [Streptomyces sp. NPDC058583]|uniref:WXG100-like domain-containing protein n=1 Tax=Streptomyces sp. NPDC058583 TaxID=3346549 RepID=UPI003662BA41